MGAGQPELVKHRASNLTDSPEALGVRLDKVILAYAAFAGAAPRLSVNGPANV